MEEDTEQGIEKPGVQNPAHVLAHKLQENRKSLHIARVPEETKEEFTTFANEEFCGDYGMALKWLIDDIPNQDIRMIIAKIEEQEARIQNLESVNHPGEELSTENGVKMLNGKKIAVRGLKKSG